MNGWKITSIIFIVLFIAETSIVILLINKGNDIIKKENICSTNICKNNNYNGYFFDSLTDNCICYKDHVIVYQEVIK